MDAGRPKPRCWQGHFLLEARRERSSLHIPASDGGWQPMRVPGLERHHYKLCSHLLKNVFSSRCVAVSPTAKQDHTQSTGGEDFHLCFGGHNPWIKERHGVGRSRSDGDPIPRDRFLQRQGCLDRTANVDGMVATVTAQGQRGLALSTRGLCRQTSWPKRGLQKMRRCLKAEEELISARLVNVTSSHP